MTKQELELSLKKFSDAFARLSELQDKRIDADILRDATIQRFEFTYELCWKACKIYLNYKGIECSSPRDVFENAFRQDLIQTDEERIFLDMLKDRNLTSHVYRESVANEVYQHITQNYIRVFSSLLSRLQNSISA